MIARLQAHCSDYKMDKQLIDIVLTQEKSSYCFWIL
jgi:hypothetical protein